MVELVRIIARRVPWPDLAAKPNRSGLRLRWDALTEAGELLAAATEHPLADGAHVLAERGLPSETLVTLRHEGARHDSFVPMPLRIPAMRGAKRSEASARIAARLARGSKGTPEPGSARPMGCPEGRGLPLPVSRPAFSDARDSQ
jgi:hypothetical protein